MRSFLLWSMVLWCRYTISIFVGIGLVRNAFLFFIGTGYSGSYSLDDASSAVDTNSSELVAGDIANLQFSHFILHVIGAIVKDGTRRRLVGVKTSLILA